MTCRCAVGVSVPKRIFMQTGVQPFLRPLYIRTLWGRWALLDGDADSARVQLHCAEALERVFLACAAGRDVRPASAAQDRRARLKTGGEDVLKIFDSEASGCNTSERD